MASIKAKKGNSFEYNTAYSLKKEGYNVEVIGDNTEGLDIIASKNNTVYYIECKNRQGMSWNQLIKFLEKTKDKVDEHDRRIKPILVFKSNYQPTLVMYYYINKFPVILKFDDFFKTTWEKRPKGYKLWKGEPNEVS